MGYDVYMHIANSSFKNMSKRKIINVRLCYLVHECIYGVLADAHHNSAKICLTLHMKAHN